MDRKTLIETVGERAIPEDMRDAFQKRMNAGHLDEAEEVVRKWIHRALANKNISPEEAARLNGLRHALDDAPPV